MLKPVGHIFVFSNQIMNCPMKNLWDELNWDNNRFIVTERRTTMKQIICKYLICQDIVQNPFWWDNEIKRSKTPYKQRRCWINLLQAVCVLTIIFECKQCYSFRNWWETNLFCTCLKQEGWAMNITILLNFWLETFYDVMWSRFNAVYLYIPTDFSIYQLSIAAHPNFMRSGQSTFALFLCFSANKKR